MTTKTYNGWTNYETWLCKLWIDNDEGSSGYWNERAEEALKRADGDKEEAVRELADALEAEHVEAQPEVTGLWADMLNSALSEINWREIAESMLEDVELEDEA
jgi:hypothetical protein